MHELSIAQELIEIIKQSVSEQQWHLIKSVEIEVGAFSNVLADSLKFCFDATIDNTELNNVELIIKEIPLKIKCNTCGAESIIDDFLYICPQCNDTNIIILTGKELNINQIELYENNQ